jgi:hypothetical protein
VQRSLESWDDYQRKKKAPETVVQELPKLGHHYRNSVTLEEVRMLQRQWNATRYPLKGSETSQSHVPNGNSAITKEIKMP